MDADVEIDTVVAVDDIPADRLHVLNEKFYSIDYLIAGGADSNTEYSGSSASSSSGSGNDDELKHNDSEMDKDDDNDEDVEGEDESVVDTVPCSDIDNEYASSGRGRGVSCGGTSMSHVAASHVISLSRKYARDNAATVLARADVLAATVDEQKGTSSAKVSGRIGLLDLFITNAAISWGPGKNSARVVEECGRESEEEEEGQRQGTSTSMDANGDGVAGASGASGGGGATGSKNANAGASADASESSRDYPPFYDARSDAADAEWATTAGVRTLSCVACFSVISRSFQRDERAPRSTVQYLLTAPSIGVTANMSVLLPASELGVCGALALTQPSTSSLTTTAAAAGEGELTSLASLPSSPPPSSLSRAPVGKRRGREEYLIQPPPLPPRAFHPLLCIACGTEVGGLSADFAAVMIVTGGFEDGMTLE